MKTKALEIGIISVLLMLLALLVVGCEEKVDAEAKAAQEVYDISFLYKPPNGFRSALRDLKRPYIMDCDPVDSYLNSFMIELHEINVQQSHKIIDLEARISALEARIDPNDD
jgi:hypothetical protein